MSHQDHIFVISNYLLHPLHQKFHNDLLCRYKLSLPKVSFICSNALYHASVFHLLLRRQMFERSARSLSIRCRVV